MNRRPFQLIDAAVAEIAEAHSRLVTRFQNAFAQARATPPAEPEPFGEWFSRELRRRGPSAGDVETRSIEDKKAGLPRISRQQVNRLMHGKSFRRGPNAATLTTIAKATGIDLEELLRRTEEEKKKEKSEC